MAKRQDIGKSGEDIAKQYLQNKGYEILHSNWRTGHKEVDIIAKMGNEIVFVEVKACQSSTYRSPIEAVDVKKQKCLIEAAELFLEASTLEYELRFDVIGIVFYKEKYEIEHIVAAFSGF